MRFLVDAQLPPVLARWLASRGHAAAHIIDVGPRDASDVQLWAYSLDDDAVVVTKDEDFSHMALLRSPAPAILWIRLGNTRTAALLTWFEPLLGDVVARVEAGDRLIELR